MSCWLQDNMLLFKARYKDYSLSILFLYIKFLVSNIIYRNNIITNNLFNGGSYDRVFE